MTRCSMLELLLSSAKLWFVNFIKNYENWRLQYMPLDKFSVIYPIIFLNAEAHCYLTKCTVIIFPSSTQLIKYQFITNGNLRKVGIAGVGSLGAVYV